MPDTAPSNPRANPHRTRDLILVACSFVVGFFAVRYRGQGFDLGLVLLSAALFWLAVLDSAWHTPRRSRILVTLASAVLIGIAVLVIIAVVLVLKPRVPTVNVPPASAPVPTSVNP